MFHVTCLNLLFCIHKQPEKYGIHYRKRKTSGTTNQEKSSNKLEVPSVRKRKRKSSEMKTEDGYGSGSSGADDNTHEVISQMVTIATSLFHIIAGARNYLKQHAKVF